VKTRPNPSPPNCRLERSARGKEGVRLTTDGGWCPSLNFSNGWEAVIRSSRLYDASSAPVADIRGRPIKMKTSA
jgi:hypothetical protein